MVSPSGLKSASSPTYKNVFEATTQVVLPGISQRLINNLNSLFNSIVGTVTMIEIKFPQLRNSIVQLAYSHYSDLEKEQDKDFRKKLKKSLDKYRKAHPQQLPSSYAMQVAMKAQRLIEKAAQRRTDVALVESGSFLRPSELEFTRDRWLRLMAEKESLTDQMPKIISQIKQADNSDVRQVLIQQFRQDKVEPSKIPREAMFYQSITWIKFSHMALDYFEKRYFELYPTGINPKPPQETIRGVEVAISYHLSLLMLQIERIKWRYFGDSFGKKQTVPSIYFSCVDLAKNLIEIDSDMDSIKFAGSSIIEKPVKSSALKQSGADVPQLQVVPDQKSGIIVISKKSPEWTFFYQDMMQLDKTLAHLAELMPSLKKVTINTPRTTPGASPSSSAGNSPANSPRLFPVTPFTRGGSGISSTTPRSNPGSRILGQTPRTSTILDMGRLGKSTTDEFGDEWNSLVALFAQGSNVVVTLANKLAHIDFYEELSAYTSSPCSSPNLPGAVEEENYVDVIDFNDPYATPLLGYFYELTCIVEALMREYLALFDSKRPTDLIDKYMQELKKKSHEHFNEKIHPKLKEIKSDASFRLQIEDLRIRKLSQAVFKLAREISPHGKFTLPIVQADLVSAIEDRELRDIFNAYVKETMTFKQFKAQLSTRNLSDGLRINLGEGQVNPVSLSDSPEAKFWNKLFTFVAEKEKQAALQWNILLKRPFAEQESRFKAAYAQSDFSDEWFNLNQLVDVFLRLQGLKKFTRLSLVKDHRYPYRTPPQDIEGRLKEIESSFSKTRIKVLGPEDQRKRLEAACQSVSGVERDKRELQLLTSCNIVQAVESIVTAMNNLELLYNFREEMQAKKKSAPSSSPASPKKSSLKSSDMKREKRNISISADAPVNPAAILMKQIAKATAVFYRGAMMVMSLPLPPTTKKK